MKKIIIFGATGNVGSYVVRYAKKYFDSDEFEIVASGRRKTNVFDSMGIKYYSVDISKAEDFDVLPKEDIYAVIYLAADIPAYMDGYFPEKYIKSNVLGAFNVLEYCRKNNADRLLFSTSGYDVFEASKRGQIITSDMPYDFSYTGDHAVYVLAKNFVIELMEHYYQEYGLKKFVFRFPTIYSYSPNHYYYPNGVKTLRPLYKMIGQAMKGEPIELWGDPNYSKDMVYVDDCAQMFCKAVEADREGGFYNIGTGVPVTLLQQIETIIDVFSPENKKSKIVFCPEKPCGGGCLMNIDNAKAELGYDPKFDVKALFEEYKKEMQVNRFAELRGIDN
jgi:UDP-glucose 4-epimerase